eukprot:GDKJ01021575.1.p3 GENE.GDKJ01021575.1~~GDKJ01021575.1.p3  ORF type:complete len:165 (-),score=18.34 GDKJ01021575.1:2591-3085(-)
MIAIKKNTDGNFTSIRAIAQEVWPVAYGSILSQEQLDYMMEMMYSVPSLQQQSASDREFILATENDEAVGFASYEFNSGGTSKTKIHKIYILSNQQGKGIGKILIDYISEEAQKKQQSAIVLNVNKHNVAQHFYRKLGFEIIKEEVIDIGKGYVMDDYVMEMPV